MRTIFARCVALASVFAASCGIAPPARAQYTTEPATLGTGGYILNFDVLWTCDDSPGGTVSAPGEVDLLDIHGNTVASVFATANGTTPVVTVSGAGSVSNVTSAIHIEGANGTPADGILHATWNITGPAPGPYTLRLWVQTRSLPRVATSAITTDTRDFGGGGTVNAPTPTPTPTPTPSPTPSPTPTPTAAPTPTPTPTPPPSPPTIILNSPSAATVFQAVGIGATASMPPGGRPLASVVIQVSEDNGNTWSALLNNSRPVNPTDSESLSYPFGSVGAALLRATATDTSGQTASSSQSVIVGQASQQAVTLSPATATVVAGQSVAFNASGGATGIYSWGGAASGAGAVQTVAFPTPGTYVVTVLDTGNADYGPSPPATATVTVETPFYTLSAVASSGGTVAGGGSYPPNAQATAVATAAPGYSFTGWTGDVTTGGPSISVLMNSDKSIMAHFTPLLPQTITFVAPGPLTTRSPAFSLTVTASSGLPVSLVLDSGPAALASSVVTPTGSPGEVTVTATQPGNALYLPATPVVITFAIGTPSPGVVFSDDSAATKKSDKATRTTSYTSGPLP